MTSNKKILLVEGEADKLFFASLLKKANISNVDVSPPLNLGGEANGKQNAIDLLPSLIKQFEDGRLRHLAIVVDADFKANGLGHQNAINRVTRILIAAGYIVPNPYPSKRTRYVFSHPAGLPDIGLWVMPDCSSDGVLENLVRSSVAGSQSALFQSAQNAVGAINQPLFSENNKVKAEIYTWLSWQKMPGKGIQSAVGDDLIDVNAKPAKQCVAWLREVFH